MKYANLPADKQIGRFTWNHQAHLGSGAFGTVFLGKDTKNGNSLVAIKQLDQGQIKQQGMQAMVQKEIGITKMLNGQNTVGLIEHLQSTSRIYIIQQFCNGGDLRHYMEKKGKLDEQEAKKIFAQMLQGYSEMKGKNLVHRDLKPDNVLIHDGIHKLADYGLSTDLKNFDNEQMTMSCGTPLYMAPQLLQQKPYTTKGDVFSLGIIYYEMLYGRTPWTANTMDQLVSSVCYKPVTFPAHVKVSNESKEFIKKCLQKEENKRLALKDLLNDPLFKTQSANLHYSAEVDFSQDIKDIILKLQFIARKQKGIKKLFKQFDKSGNLKLDMNEFTKLILALDSSISQTNCQKIFQQFDSDKSGQISYSEFKSMVETDYEDQGENQMMVEYRNQKILRNLYDLVIKHNLDVTEIFQNFDTSGDAELDKGEFAKILKIIQEDITDKEVYYAFKKFDTDNSGSVSLQEFIAQMKKGVEAQGGKLSFKADIQKSNLSSVGQAILRKLNRAVTVNSIDIKSLFVTFDKDKSGTLDFKEFYYMVKIIDALVTEPQAKEVFKAYDPDGSGQLDYNEFIAVFK